MLLMTQVSVEDFLRRVEADPEEGAAARAATLIGTEECFADESYIPTLLAYKGMADETSCIRGPIAFREARCVCVRSGRDDAGGLLG